MARRLDSSAPSRGATTTPYTARQLASDLTRLLGHLGIASAAVLGYSQGGAIAQQLVLDHHSDAIASGLVCTYAFNMATPRENDARRRGLER